MSSRKNRSPEEQARRAKIRELLEMSDITGMADIQSLVKETIAEFMEEGLDAELEDELGFSKYDYCFAAVLSALFLLCSLGIPSEL